MLGLPSCKPRQLPACCCQERSRCEGAGTLASTATVERSSGLPCRSTSWEAGMFQGSSSSSASLLPSPSPSAVRSWASSSPSCGPACSEASSVAEVSGAVSRASGSDELSAAAGSGAALRAVCLPCPASLVGRPACGSLDRDHSLGPDPRAQRCRLRLRAELTPAARWTRAHQRTGAACPASRPVRRPPQPGTPCRRRPPPPPAPPCSQVPLWAVQQLEHQAGCATTHSLWLGRVQLGACCLPGSRLLRPRWPLSRAG